MKLATIDNGTPDGELVVISCDVRRFMRDPCGASTLQTVAESREPSASRLAALSARLDAGEREPMNQGTLRAPLPRAWQWLEGSAFERPGALMQTAFGIYPISTDRPLMYQGLSGKFLGPHDDVPMVDETLGIYFESEFGVIIDAVQMGDTPAAALGHIKLFVQINDWTLRTLTPIEMKTGFGWVQTKPACSAAPFAVTPDDLDDSWHDGRVCLDLVLDWNGSRFGNANGKAIAFGFHKLVAHAARTRDLPAATIIGWGTVLNEKYCEIGSSCIAERRAIEQEVVKA